jgi:hypothetical protein
VYLKYVQIVNYKNLRKTRFEFGEGANTVIGENDSGKSNAMTAMRILLDDDYFYNTKRLKETDFSESLEDWRGHWIIISAFFDQITDEDKQSEVCSQISPGEENENFLKSFIRCEGNNYGVVTLFIRPNKNQRKALFEAQTKNDFDNARSNISLLDYEFLYTVRSQATFTDEEVYKGIVGDFEKGDAPNPDDEDSYIIGTKVDILDIWKHISLEFIDALRDAQGELRKPKNPLRRIFDVVNQEVDSETIDSIKDKIRELNQSLSDIPQIQNIGNDVNKKLNDIVGLVYSPEICVESHIREEIESIARNLTVVPADKDDIDQLGLGHLNILYIALKLVEFEVSRNHEVLNIMIVEEPEAHIHTHIQRTLFENLNIKENYTQVIMTTHSTHLSEVSNITKMNVLMRRGNQAIVMRPNNGLQEFAEESFGIADLSIEQCIERYLDAKRSVLLFSKAVILVEGDGEELLIPSLVKQYFGVSLDELGIGLINVGSVAFEYVACIFSDERIQRRCAIVTDLDVVVENAEKCSENAAQLGANRKQKIDDLFGDDIWVSGFFAPHTLEIDFYNLEDNRKHLKKFINQHYKQKATKEKHIANLSASGADRYDTVLTVVKELGKGWHAILLASDIDRTVRIPEYIIQALAFATQDVITPYILKRMALYVIESYEDESNLKNNMYNARTEEEILESLDVICAKYEEDEFTLFAELWKEYKGYE